MFHFPDASCSCSASQATSQASNAFSMLMKRSEILQSVPRITIENAKKKQTFNDIIELLGRYNIQFTSSNLHSLGKNLVKNLIALLLNTSLYHEYFSDPWKHVPEMLKPFTNLNHYVSKKKAKPMLSGKELQELVECLCVEFSIQNVILRVSRRIVFNC